MHAPGHLSVGSHSEWNTGANTLIGPQLKGGKWLPQAHAVTLSSRYFNGPSHQVNQGNLYLKHYMKICTTMLDM